MPDAPHPIDHETTAHGGRYVIRGLGGSEDPELLWRARGEGVRVITHTGVPHDLEGRGLAKQLFDRIVADARAQGFKIDPRCSYAEVQFERHPELADVRA